MAFQDQVYLTDEDGIVALLRGMIERKDRSEFMRQLQVPQMIVLGRHDEYITAEVAEKLIEAEPQAEGAFGSHESHRRTRSISRRVLALSYEAD